VNDYCHTYRKLSGTKASNNTELKCAIDHILEAQNRGEITEENVLYIVENINIAAIETTLWSIEWAIAELVNHPEIQNKVREELENVLGKGNQITEADTQKLPYLQAVVKETLRLRTIETTLWSIEWAIAELVNHPDIQNKVREELDNVLGKGNQITEADTHRLPYLQAVVKETLRLRMAIPLLVPHMNVHGAKLGGHDIPAESKILVNAWWLANNPLHWQQPEEFRPERFLEEESKVETNGNDFRYLPFGVGRRSCPGIILALPIISITLGRLIQNFELLPPPGQSKIDTTEQRGQFSLHVRNHSTVVLKPRV
ncbi:hypothetical protein KSS87_000888, partial [Heliosperma pusillum]